MAHTDNELNAFTKNVHDYFIVKKLCKPGDRNFWIENLYESKISLRATGCVVGSDKEMMFFDYVYFENTNKTRVSLYTHKETRTF